MGKGQRNRKRKQNGSRGKRSVDKKEGKATPKEDQPKKDSGNGNPGCSAEVDAGYRGPGPSRNYAVPIYLNIPSDSDDDMTELEEQLKRIFK